MSNESPNDQHKGVITINMDMRVQQEGSAEKRLFERGQQYYHFGTITKKTGCTPCGTDTYTPFWIVICAYATYHVDSRYASENVPTGPIPSMIDRVNNLGDGFTSTPDSATTGAEEIARAEAFKLKIP
jgi:hypothetical protein